MKKGFSYWMLLLLMLVLLFPVDVEAQCAMCKAAAETSAKHDPNSMARNLNAGILYLMAVPYIALCIIFRKQIFQIWKKLRS